MTERRFSEAEVAAIFERATETTVANQRALSSGEGMTLAEIQSIGREVGVSDASIAAAARMVQAAPTAPESFVGLPIAVERSVELPRKLTDEEWERFVVRLRDTFSARGKMTAEGSLRQWTNGNLQVLHEPTDTGYRIRMRTVKGNARGAITGGSVMMVVSAGIFGMMGMTGGIPDVGAAMAAGSLGVFGAAMLANTALLQLPAWARTRAAQMEALAAHLESMRQLPE